VTAPLYSERDVVVVIEFLPNIAPHKPNGIAFTVLRKAETNI